MRSSGRKGVFVSPAGPMRVTATSISSSGFAEDTDQSLPKATMPPLRRTLPIG